MHKRRIRWFLVFVGLFGGGCASQQTHNGKESTASKVVVPARDLFEMKMRCAEIGRQYEAQQDSPMRAWYGYSEKLNTCLYRNVVFTKGTGGFEDRIIDLGTGTFLVVFDGGRLYETTRDEFRNSALELIGFDPYAGPDKNAK